MTGKAQAQIEQIYSYMDQNSEIIENPNVVDDFIGKPIQVWKGFTRDISTALGYTNPVTSKAVRNLTIVGCISLIRHGAAGTPSTYQMLRQPTYDEYAKLQERSTTIDRERAPTPWQITQDSINRLHTLVRDLERRVDRLENVAKSPEVRDIGK